MSKRRFALVVACCTALVGVTSGVASSGGRQLLVRAGSEQLVEAVRLEPVHRTPVLQPPPPGRLAFPVDAADDCFAPDNFGDPRGNRRHEGFDISGSKGRAVYSISAGEITQRYDERFDSEGRPALSGAGIGWKIYDADNDVVYKYFHLQRHQPGLAVGDTVEFGDVIGFVGNTGTSGARTDTNYHLHFEYRPGNVAVDPRPLMEPHPNCPLD